MLRTSYKLKCKNCGWEFTSFAKNNYCPHCGEACSAPNLGSEIKETPAVTLHAEVKHKENVKKFKKYKHSFIRDSCGQDPNVLVETADVNLENWLNEMQTKHGTDFKIISHTYNEKLRYFSVIYSIKE